MQVNLYRQVTLVTGAGAGIGKAIALAMARNGADVIVNDIDDSGEQTAAEIRSLGRESIFCKADVSRADQVERMVAGLPEAFSSVEILVNNAGVGVSPQHRRPIHEFDLAEWRRVIDTDLNGLFYCLRMVSPGMVERRKGVIINIASVMGLIPSRLQAPYIAAKAAVINLTRSAALELAPFGVRVNAVAPGSTLTRGTEELFYNPDKRELAESLLSHIPLHRPGTTDETASAVVFLASPEASYITGSVITVDGGWTAGYARDW